MSHERDAMHRRLDELLDNLEKLKGQNNAWSHGHARLALGAGARFAASVIGAEALAAAYGDTPDSAERPAILDMLGHRLITAAEIFGSLDRVSDPASLSAAAEEVRAIAGGDEPRLFVRDGRKVAYRLSMLRLRALEWDSYLEAKKVPAYARQARIAEAHCLGWSAIAKWRQLCVKDLGEEMVARHVRQAKFWAEYDMPLLGASDPNDWKASVDADGMRYRDETKLTPSLSA